MEYLKYVIIVMCVGRMSVCNYCDVHKKDVSMTIILILCRKDVKRKDLDSIQLLDSMSHLCNLFL
jgi:hypothetical protein